MRAPYPITPGEREMQQVLRLVDRTVRGRPVSRGQQEDGAGHARARVAVLDHLQGQLNLPAGSTIRPDQVIRVNEFQARADGTIVAGTAQNPRARGKPVDASYLSTAADGRPMRVNVEIDTIDDRAGENRASIYRDLQAHNVSVVVDPWSGRPLHGEIQAPGQPPRPMTAAELAGYVEQLPPLRRDDSGHSPPDAAQTAPRTDRRRRAALRGRPGRPGPPPRGGRGGGSGTPSATPGGGAAPAGPGGAPPVAGARSLLGAGVRRSPPGARMRPPGVRAPAPPRRPVGLGLRPAMGVRRPMGQRPPPRGFGMAAPRRAAPLFGARRRPALAPAARRPLPARPVGMGMRRPPVSARPVGMGMRRPPVAPGRPLFGRPPVAPRRPLFGRAPSRSSLLREAELMLEL